MSITALLMRVNFKTLMNMKICYVLFETDIYKTKSSRIFLGVFSSFELANHFAKINNCYTNKIEVVILEVEVDKFEEL